MSSITLIGNINGIKKILVTLNAQADDALITKEWEYASTKAASIYREGGKTLPALQTDDPNLWNIVEHLAAYLIVKRLSNSLEGKMAADKDIKDATDEIWLHIGVNLNPNVQPDISDPVAVVGPRMTGLGDSSDEC